MFTQQIHTYFTAYIHINTLTLLRHPQQIFKFLTDLYQESKIAKDILNYVNYYSSHVTSGVRLSTYLFVSNVQIIMYERGDVHFVTAKNILKSIEMAIFRRALMSYKQPINPHDETQLIRLARGVVLTRRFPGLDRATLDKVIGCVTATLKANITEYGFGAVTYQHIVGADIGDISSKPGILITMKDMHLALSPAYPYPDYVVCNCLIADDLALDPAEDTPLILHRFNMYRNFKLVICRRKMTAQRRHDYFALGTFCIVDDLSVTQFHVYRTLLGLYCMSSVLLLCMVYILEYTVV